MLFKRIARPTETCVTLAQVKANLRIGHSAEDDLIGLYIEAAQSHIQDKTNRAIMRQRFRLRTDRVEPRFSLWYPPFEGDVSIVSVKGSVGGRVLNFAAPGYALGSSDMLPSISFATITSIEAGYLEIDYDTGSESVLDVPAPVRLAVMQLAGHFYRNREATTSDSRVTDIEKKIPYGVEALIGPFRIPNTNVPFYTEG